MYGCYGSRVVCGALFSTDLLLCRRQHGYYRETDCLDRERGAPVVCKDGEADVAVAVDVRVHGDVVAHENNFGRVERILGAKLEAEREPLAVVQGVGGAAHLNRPTEGVGEKLLK
jgi:hypothetical protein